MIVNVNKLIGGIKLKLNFKETEVVKQAIIDKILELQERANFLNEIKKANLKLPGLLSITSQKKQKSI